MPRNRQCNSHTHILINEERGIRVFEIAKHSTVDDLPYAGSG